MPSVRSHVTNGFLSRLFPRSWQARTDIYKFLVPAMHTKTKGTLRGRNASSALASPPEQITRLLLLFTNTLDHLYGIGKYHIPFTCAETHRNIERRALVVASACMSWVHNCLSWHHRAFQGDPHLNVKSTQAATGPLSRDTCIPEGLFGLRWKACVRVNRFENLSKGCLYRGYLLCDIFFLPISSFFILNWQ